MKVRAIVAGVLAICILPRIVLGEPSPTPAFKELSAAVQFIVHCIDEQAAEQFSGAFVAEPRNNTTMHKNVLKGLTEIHRKTPLTMLYLNRQFPETGTTFLLGGHDKELGFINITFSKKSEAWYLADAYYCR